MADSCLYFLLGLLHVIFLNYNTPFTTVLSVHILLLSLYLYTSSVVKLDMQINEGDLMYFVLMHIFEHFIFNGYIRYRVISVVGGLITLIGLLAFILSLSVCMINNTNKPFKGPYSFVRHPLHSSLLVFFAGVCVYLSSFISLGALVWYLKQKSESFKALDKIYQNHEEYLNVVPSGIPFMITDSKRKKD